MNAVLCSNYFPCTCDMESEKGPGFSPPFFSSELSRDGDHHCDISRALAWGRRGDAIAALAFIQQHCTVLSASMSFYSTSSDQHSCVCTCLCFCPSVFSLFPQKAGKSDSNKSKKIFVGGIPHNCGEPELRDYFNRFGVVSSST